MHEVFHHNSAQGHDTTFFCYKLAVEMTTTLLELKDIHKTIQQYLLPAITQCTQAVIPKGEEFTVLEIRPHYDLFEGTLATFTDIDILCHFGHINQQSASGICHSQHKNDFTSGHKRIVTGKKSKTNLEPATKGTLHLLVAAFLPDCLQ